jgi:hypothetical protein
MGAWKLGLSDETRFTLLGFLYPARNVARNVNDVSKANRCWGTMNLQRLDNRTVIKEVP